MDNVFEPSFGNMPDRIVGRDEELAQIDKGLAARIGSRDRAMLITGQRGMGKTALLLEVEARARQTGYVTARVTENEDMLGNLVERLQINGRPFVADEKKAVRGVSAGAFGFSVGLTFSDEVRENYGFQTKLELLCDRLAESGKGVLLLIDEVQATSREMRALAGAYQQLVGDRKNIAICMAGLPASVSDVLNDKVLTFFNRAAKIRLGELELPPIRSYYASTFNRAGVLFAPGVLDRAVSATRGFPYLLQLIGYYLVEEAGAERTITSEMLGNALADARDDMRENVFRPTLAALSPTDVRVLAAYARSALGNGGVARTADVQQDLDKDNGYVQVYRRRLIEAGVVTPVREGELEFCVPLLAEHLSDVQAPK